MKIYIASGLQNKEQVRYVRQKLMEVGFSHTYDWTKNERATDEEGLRKIGEQEKQAVIESDFLILLLPGGKGTHTEFGMALALGKPVYLFSPTTMNLSEMTTFYYVDGVERFVGEIDDFITKIITTNK
ncbi:group-specific protein [Ornithinibacillus sp. L9]|uniref:Group-specific protein n=1 Tax=Ornithinibacillus caprae TaxID=2678566 RepID=A0A6N8FIS1_9BACI|nr:nucleoside 2-deoxyribosyltransferase [Ornithinibacillus caprae]MUK88174.1 group-specific protein [Ornithinibacillus caprae]